jgi:hypothetical protein
MTIAFKKPEHKISFGQLAGVIVIQVANVDGLTIAWLDDDGRYLTTVEGEQCFEFCVKKWISEWFKIRPNQNVKILRFNRTMNGETFIIQIKRIPNVSA